MKKDDVIFYSFLGAAGTLIIGGLFIAGGLAFMAAAPLMMAFMWRNALPKKKKEDEKE